MWECPSCGFDNSEDYDKCMFCGADKESVTQSASVSQPPASPVPARVEVAPAWETSPLKPDVCGANAFSSSIDQLDDSPANDAKDMRGVIPYEPALGPDRTSGASASLSAEAAQASQAVALEPSGDSVLVLVEGRSGEEIRIDAMSCVLGREGDYRPELFSARVSREQLEINHREDGMWTACHIGSTNPSLLISSDGRINMEYGVEYPLHGKERLRLANQTFLVRVEPIGSEESAAVTAEMTPSSETAATSGGAEEASDLVEGWFVVCNKCGATFQVAKGTSRLDSCPNCIDVMDKRDIKRVAAVYGRKNRKAIVDVR